MGSFDILEKKEELAAKMDKIHSVTVKGWRCDQVRRRTSKSTRKYNLTFHKPGTSQLVLIRPESGLLILKSAHVASENSASKNSAGKKGRVLPVVSISYRLHNERFLPQGSLSSEQQSQTLGVEGLTENVLGRGIRAKLVSCLKATHSVNWILMT